jgi:hypothetical protein
MRDLTEGLFADCDRLFTAAMENAGMSALDMLTSTDKDDFKLVAECIAAYKDAKEYSLEFASRFDYLTDKVEVLEKQNEELMKEVQDMHKEQRSIYDEILKLSADKQKEEKRA